MADRLDDLEKKIRGGPSRIDELEARIRGESSVAPEPVSNDYVEQDYIPSLPPSEPTDTSEGLAKVMARRQYEETPEGAAEVRRYEQLPMALGKAEQRNPGVRDRFIQSQQQPLSPELGLRDRAMLDFTRNLAPTLSLAARFARASSLNGGSGIPGVSEETMSPLYDTSYLDDLSRMNPSKGLGETLLRTGASASGFGLGVAASPGMLYAKAGSGLAGRLGAGYLSRTAAGISGFALPEMTTQMLEGTATPYQAAKHTLLAGPEFALESPRMVSNAASNLVEGDLMRATESIAPLALMGAGALGKKAPYKQTMRPTGDVSAKVPIYNKYAPSMIDVVREQGNYGNVLANRAQKAVDKSSALAGELANPVLKFKNTLRRSTGRAVKEVAGDATEAQRTEAFNSLSSNIPDPSSPKFGYSKMRTLVDPNSTTVPPGTPINAIEARAASQADGIVQQQFKMGQREGTLILDRKTNTLKDMHGKTYSKWPRIFVDYFYDLMKKPKSVEYKELDAYLKANNKGIGLKKASEYLEQNKGVNAERNIGALEVTRIFEKFPDTQVDANGKVQWLTEPDPINAIDRIVQSGSDRIAFNKFFGQRVRGVGDKSVDRYREKAREQGVNPSDYDNMIAALNNRNVTIREQNYLGKPNNALSQATRGALQIFDALQLSTSGAIQPAEIIGSTLPFVGARGMARGMVEAAKDPLANRNLMRQRGLITTNPMNLRSSPNAKMESGLKGVARGIRTATGLDPLNELNEHESAIGASGFADVLRSGKGKPVDAEVLRTFQFQPREVDALMSGKAPPELYDAVASRLAKTQPTTLRKAEQSYVANHPGWRTLAKYQSYAQNSARIRMRVLGNWSDSIAEGFKTGNWSRVAPATEVAAKWAGGRTLQGAVQLTILSLIAGKTLDRSDETAPEWLGKSFASGEISGPFQSATSVATGENTLSESAASAIPYLRSANDIIQIARGEKSGKDQTPAGRALEVAKRITPISKIAGAYTALTGYKDPQIDAARAKYWKWYKGYYGGIPSGPSDPGYEDFRRNLDEAYTAIRAKRFDDALGSMNLALAAGKEKGIKEVRQSLNAQKLLADLKPEARADLEKKIGAKTVEAMKTHDALIDNFIWANELAGRYYGRQVELKRKKKTGKLTEDESVELAGFEIINRKLGEVRSAKDAAESAEDRKSLQEAIDQMMSIQLGIEEK